MCFIEDFYPAPRFSKHFLRSLPDRQGFDYVGYEPDTDLYTFQRRDLSKSYSFEISEIKHSDIMDGSYKYFFQHKLSRVA